MGNISVGLHFMGPTTIFYKYTQCLSKTFQHTSKNWEDKDSQQVNMDINDSDS